MKRKMVSAMCGAAVLGIWSILADAQVHAPPAKVEGKQADQAIPGTLEGMLEVALRSNPQILVAEAKLRQAQAELNQARLEVTKQIADLCNQKRSKQLSLESLKESIEVAKKKVDTGTATHSELDKAMLAFADGEVALQSLEAQIRYILGTGGDVRLPEATVGESAGKVGGAPRRIRRPEVPEKIRAILEKPIQANFSSVPLKDVLAFLQDQSAMAFILQEGLDGEVSTNLSFPGPLPLRAVLIALHDRNQEICFIVREYGILVAQTGMASWISGAAVPPEIPFEADEEPPESPPQGR